MAFDAETSPERPLVLLYINSVSTLLPFYTPPHPALMPRGIAPYGNPSLGETRFRCGESPVFGGPPLRGHKISTMSKRGVQRCGVWSAASSAPAFIIRSCFAASDKFPGFRKRGGAPQLDLHEHT
jgi:hypothetical protein